MAVSEEAVRGLIPAQASLAGLLAERRLCLLDYEILQGLQPVYGRFCVAPIALFWLGGCRAWGRARAEASFGASQGAGEAWDWPPLRAGNAGGHRKSPRPDPKPDSLLDHALEGFGVAAHAVAAAYGRLWPPMAANGRLRR